MAYEELEDGTRVYRNGFRYKPVPLEQRKYRKFPTGTQWYGGQPFGPKNFLPDDKRAMPATIPDDLAAEHKLGCLCQYCRVERVQRLKRQQWGIRVAKDNRALRPE
jgi:hypothetical protein